MDLREIPGRGVGVVATRPLAAGEVILSELPILMYPQASAAAACCAHCLRCLAAPAPAACPTCAAARFCSPECAAAAAVDAGSHCPLVCRALAACNAAGLSDEDQTSLHYLLRAASLLLAAAAGDAGAGARAAQLTSLAGRPPGAAAADADALRARELHGRVAMALAAAGADPAAVAASVTPDAVAALVQRDEVNGYAIPAPEAAGGADDEEDRRLRGSALYAAASRVNHECLPNAARFDAFDAPRPPGAAPLSSAALSLRMLHALPAGEEVTQSYFPLTWVFSQRQERCRGLYGFTCRCPRCREEATWPPEERGDEEEGDPGAAAAAAADVLAPGALGVSPDVADAGYVHVFLSKYVCPRGGCGGTAAPLPTDPHTLQCNVCGGTRTEAEFLAALDAASD